MDIQSKFRAIMAGVAFAAYAGTPAIAEDIEIYTTANLGSTVIQPNVMFVVDSSLSMQATLSVPTKYDYTQVYVGCYDANMLYFTSSGNIPACESKDKILKASNRCDASVNLYDKGAIIDPIGPLEEHGFYADQVAHYNTKKNIWQALLTRNDSEWAYLLECYTDWGVGGVAGGGVGGVWVG